MRIGIDARLYGNKHTGIGRYVQNLILNLAKIDRKNTYIIFGGEDVEEDIKNLKNFKFKKLNTPIYSLSEQILNPFIFARAKLDLLHVPHFNAPIFYPGCLVLTIHDLIKHISTGKETSTLRPVIYWIKHLVYRFVVAVNIKKAKIIITPSKFWQNSLIHNYNLNPQKVRVTYEAVDRALKIKQKPNRKDTLRKYNLRKPFIIYIGNLYPHKNVNFLIESLKTFNKTHKHQLILAIICARSVFEEKLTKSNDVRYLGYVPDNELAILYSQSLALVHPSLIEGFGLTGLEAMAVGLPVLSSDATCLPEVYGNAALYFDPYNRKSLILRLEQIIGDKEILQNLKNKGLLRSKRFSWTRTARETIEAYNQAMQ